MSPQSAYAIIALTCRFVAQDIFLKARPAYVMFGHMICQVFYGYTGWRDIFI